MTDSKDFRSQLMELSRLASRVAETMADEVQKAGQLLVTCFSSGGRVLACGNGGSAADAQHFVAELVGRMTRERRSLPAHALSSDPSVVTALGNDYGYERIFSRQVEGYAKRGDVLLGISTSGRSPNVLAAFKAAEEAGVFTIALIGEQIDPSLTGCDVCLSVPSSDTQRIQEIHTAVLHSLCAFVEASMKEEPYELPRKSGRTGHER